MATRPPGHQFLKRSTGISVDRPLRQCRTLRRLYLIIQNRSRRGGTRPLRPRAREKCGRFLLGSCVQQRGEIISSGCNYKRDNEKGLFEYTTALTLIAILEGLYQTARFFVAEATIVHGSTAATPHVMDMQQPQFTEPGKKFGQPLPHRRYEFTIVAPPQGYQSERQPLVSRAYGGLRQVGKNGIKPLPRLLFTFLIFDRTVLVKPLKVPRLQHKVFQASRPCRVKG